MKGDVSSFGRLLAQGSKEAFVYPIARNLNAERFASSIRNADDILYDSTIKKVDKNGNVIKVNKDAAATLKAKRDTELKAMQSSTTLNDYLRSRGFGGTIEQKTKMLAGYANTEDEKAEIADRISRATSHLESEYNKQVQAIKDDPDMPIDEKKAKLAELARQYKNNQNDILNKIFARFDIKNHARGTVTGLPFTGNTMLTKGEVVINARGASVVPKTGLYNLRDSHIINTEDAHDYLGVKGPRKSVAQAQQDENDAERRIFGNANGTLDLGKIFRGKSSVINKDVKVDKNQLAEMIKTAKESIPELAAGGLLGAVASGILGLVGGPLVGAAVGAGIKLARKSDALQTVLFGKIGEDGKRENNGLIKTEIQDVVKKYAPGMAKYGAAGFIGSLITPLGPLGGILVGSAVGFLKQNDEIREKLFGKLSITEDDKDIVKKLIPGGIKGAVIGAAVTTMFGGPFGLVGNAIVGSAIGMASTTEEFKKLMLGERINGVLQGGILDPIKDAFAPIAEAGNEFKDRIFSAIDDNIIAPIQRFVKPTLNALPRALGLIPRMIGKFIFNSKFGLGVSGLLQDFVAKPIIAAISPVAKLAGTAARIATSPLRVLGGIGNKIHKSQIDSRTDTYELASERVAFNTDVLGRKSSAYDLALAGIGSEGGMSVERAKNISQAITLYTTNRETLSRQKKSVERQITTLLNRWRGSNGQSLPRRAKAACVKAINSGATYKIADILKESGLSNEEFNGLWNQLKPLIDNWTELRTKEQEARNMSEADRSDMGKDLRAAFENELGIKDKKLFGKLDFNNMDQLNNIAKQLNMEIEDRENLANLKAPELEIKENVTDIRDVIMQWASKGIKIQEGEDKDYQDKINDIINSHNAKEGVSIREALARGTKASEGAPEESSEAVEQEASRMTSFKGIPVIGALPFIRKAPIIGKYGKHIQFRSKISKAIANYGKEIGEDILNGIAEIGKLNDNNIEDLIKIYKVFKFDAESAKLIVSKTSRRISGLIRISKNEYFKEYIENRTTNPKYATTEEVEYLLSISDSREFTRTLLRKLKLVSDCKAWAKFNSIKDIGMMSGDTEAALQSGRALNQSNYYNFFEDQETNQLIQEAKASRPGQNNNLDQETKRLIEEAEANRPEHHGLGTILLGGLGGIAGLAGGLVKGALGLGGSLLGGLGGLLFGNKNKNQTVDNNALAMATAAQASQNIKTSTDVGQTALTGDTDIKGDGKETIYTNEGPMTLKRVNRNSPLVPDTDKDTKATLNKKSLKEKMEEKVREAQIASSKAITAALDAGKATAGAAKKGMGWLTKLLLGGMLLKGLLKSGVLKKLKDSILTPLWKNLIKPKVLQFKDWVVKDIVPGIWNFAKNTLWPNIKTFFVEDIPNAFGWVKDKLENVIPAIKDGISNWWNGDGNENQGAKKQITDTIDNVKSGISTWWYGDGGENKGALNSVTDFISTKAGPFLTNTFFPALGDFTINTLWPLFKTTIGTVARSLAGAIVKGIIPSAGQFLDGFVAEDNNVGATVKVDANKIVEEKGADYLTNMKDENGNRLTAQQIKDHDYNMIFNEDGARGEDTEDGPVFTDRSAKGSEFAEATVNAALHSATNPLMTKLGINTLEGISKGSTKLSGFLAKHTTKGLIGKTAKLGIKGTNTMVQAGTKVLKAPMKMGEAIANFAPYKTIAGKVDDCIDALLSHSTVLNKLKDTALGQGISNFSGWLKSLRESLTNVFHKATQEAVSTATDAEVKTATKAAGKALLVAQLVADFLVGCDQAESIVGVTETSLLEEIICGFVNAIVNFTILFALYPGVNTIASWLFEKFAADYEERKKEAQAEYEDYIKNYSGSSKTLEEYLRKKYSASGFITESIKDAFGNIFKDNTVTNLENSPSLALAYNGNWEFTYDMTDADIAKKYSEMSQKEIRNLESNAMYDYTNGSGRNLEFLKRLQYIKDTNPSLITNDAQGQYLWTSEMSDSDILDYINNLKDNAPEQIDYLKGDYNSYGGLGNNGEIYERYLAIMGRMKQEEDLKSQGTINKNLSNISIGGANNTTGLSSKNWPETYNMTDDQIRAAWSKYSIPKTIEIQSGKGTAKEKEIYARYKLIQENKSAKDFTSTGASVAHNAAGTISLSNVLKAKLPTDNELNNSTASIGVDENKVLENNVAGMVRNSLTKLAGGVFGSVRTTMRDYATAIRSSIASFAQEDPAIRSVQDGNMSIFSKGYWNFGESSNTMGDILSDMAVGMGRTVAAPLLVVKSAMKSLTEDIKNIGPWMTTHFAELAGFFLHPMDYIYNEVLKNFLYAQSNNISGYVSPEGAVLSNVMNPYNANNITTTTTTSGGTSSSGTSSTTSSGTTTGTETTEEGTTSGGSFVDKVVDKVRTIASNARDAVGNVVNGVVNFFTGNKDKNKDTGSQSFVDKVVTTAKTVGSTVLDAGKAIGGKIVSAGNKVKDFAGNVISSAGSLLSGLFGKGKYSKQIDPSIARLRYNARGDSEYQTIGDSACGPAAAVNVIESMYGRGVNPVLSASNYALSHGYKEQDGGTRPEFFTDYFNRFGLSSDITYDKSTVERNINAGIPTVLMGSDANGTSSSHPFGSNPHYVTVTGTDGRGHAIVQDPESRYDNQVYDIKDLVKRTSIGVSAYGRKRKYGRGISKSRAKSIINNITASTAGNHNLPSRKQVLSHYTNPKYGAGRFGRGRDVENQDLCVWADVTGEELDNFIKGYAGTDTPFYGNGALFVEIGESTGMDPVYILAHSACESGWGTSKYARERGNYFGIGAYDDNPDNAHTMATSSGDFHPDGLLAGVQWIKQNYYDAGQTTLYLYNHAANGWHNYRTSTFDTEVGIMNSCYNSIPGYDNRQKKKHTGDGRSVIATSSNTNNSNGGSTTTTTKDTRNMLLIEGIKYVKDSQNGKTFSISGNTTSGTTTPSSSATTSYTPTASTTSDTTSGDSSSGSTTSSGTSIATKIVNGVKTVVSGAANIIHNVIENKDKKPTKTTNTVIKTPRRNTANDKTQYEEPIGPQPKKKEGLFTKIVNGVKKIFGKGHPYEDGRSVTKYGRGDEYQSIGQWINRIQTDNPTAQVVNSFMDTIGTKSKQEQNNAQQSTVPSSSTVTSSAGANNITGTGLAADVVRIAQHEAELTDGTNMENPNNSNSVKYNDWYYGQHVSGDAYPWCAAFVSWVLNQAGVSESILPKSALAKDFYDAVSTHVNASKSVPGDIVTFSRTGDPSDIYHVGIVENASGGKLNTIEGNTYQGSGDWGVYRVNYDLGDNRLLISHPNYGTGTKESKPMSKYGRAKDFFRRRKPSYGMGNRASEVWNWFRTHGYSEAATAGILGNMEQESGVDPEMIQGNGAGPAAGIVQWENYNTQSSRWLNMSNYAQSKGRTWKDLESQLEFIDKENKEGSDVFWSMANTYKSYDAFKNADNIIAATDSFEQAFERAGTPMMQNRYDAANKYYKQFTGKNGDAIGSYDTSGSSGGNQSADSGLQSIGQWLNNVLTNSPVAQVLNSFLDVGGSSSTTTEETSNGGDAGADSSSGGNYTGNSSLNSTPGAGGNSPLATVTILTGNNGGPRTHEIDTLTIHYMAGDMSAEGCGNWFAIPSTQASSNYGVDSSGVIGLYVEEGNRSWASANTENDDRAVTIEVANQPDGSPTQAAYNALIDLCADICIRNGIPKLLWKNDPNLVGQINQQNMTLHKWVSTMEGGTDCPGPWFSAHMGDIANDVNAKLSSSGRGKFGRGAGVKIDTSKLGISKGLGKDGKGIFGRGKTTSSVPQSKLNLLRRNGSTLYTPSNITAQITATKPNTKKQRFAKTLAELTNGRGQEPAGRSKFGRGNNVITKPNNSILFEDIDYPISKYIGLINNIATKPTGNNIIFEDTDYPNNTKDTITPTDLFNDFVAGQAEEETIGSTGSASRRYTARPINNTPNVPTTTNIPARTTLTVRQQPSTTTQSSSINYMSVIKEIVSILLKVANNTDKLNTIITILQDKLNVNVTAKDVADAQAVNSANSTAKLANALMNANNRTTNLNAYADTVNSNSVNSIITAMNAIASE